MTAALAASVGLVFALNVFTVLAAYCMVMYAIYPKLLVHEVTCLLLAGFVFSRPIGVPATCSFAVGYSVFLVAISLQRDESVVHTNVPAQPAPSPPPIPVDDI